MGSRSRLLTAALAAVLAGTPALVGATATAAPDPSKGSVSVKVSATQVLAGTQVRFTGVVKPRRAGLKVRLQQRLGNGWKSLGKTKTTSGGRYSLAAVPDEGGLFKYRVIRLPWLTNSAHSRTVTVTSYQWTNVNNIIEPGSVNVSPLDPASIDGVDYPNSLGIDADSQGHPDGGFFEVALSAEARCAAFDATVGALDGNAVGSRVGSKISVDGDVVSDASYAKGESEHLTLPLIGASRLRVEGLVVLEGPQGDLGIGTPRLLCAS